ncbi:hypothetical protein IAT40_002806 [Kwoniella sp. CBS 6097]
MADSEDSECEQIPSVTLYGTTQLTSTVTTHALITSIIRLDPTVADGETITPSTASVLSSQVITRTIVTSLVPQQTLFSPCPRDGDSTITGVAGASQGTRVGSATTAKATGEETDDPQATGQFTGVIPAYISIKSSSTRLALSSYKSTSRIPSTATDALHFSTAAATSGAASGPSNNGTSGNDTSDPSSTSSGNVGPILGGVLGGVIGPIVLIVLLVCIRKSQRNKRERRDGEEEEEEGQEGDYWERKFRQLEAEGERGEKRGSGETGDVDGVVQGVPGEDEMSRHKKLHLTLNLASKDLPSRPASRLSAISSFFATRFNPSAMVTQSPSQRSTVLPKLSMESTRPFRPPPALRSNSSSNDDLRSVRSGSLSHKSGLSFTGQTGQSGQGASGSKSPGANKLSLFFLPSMREEPQMVPLQDPPSAATARPSSSLSLSIDGGPAPAAPALGQPRPSVERGQFSPTDSEVEERRNMEWIRHSTTTAKSRESEKYAGMRRDQLKSLLSGHGVGNENQGFLTASALRRISGLSPSKPGETPTKLGTLGGVGVGVGGVGAGHSKTNHPPSITSSVLPNLTQQSRAMESELTPADSISVCDTELELENAPSESTFTMSTYSTNPSFGLSRPQSKRDSYKTLTMYKSERGSRPPSAPASTAGSRPASRRSAPGPSSTVEPRPPSSARRSLYPPRRTPSGRIISLHSQPRSEHSASASNPASPPPIPDRIVSGTPITPMQPQPGPGARTSRSMREIRMSKGKHVPELRLSRRAITPSLWIDEEALARFADAPSGKSALSKIPSERAVDSPARKTFNVDPKSEMREESRAEGDRTAVGVKGSCRSPSKRGHNREGAAGAKLESRFSDDTSEDVTSSRPVSSKHSTLKTGIEINLEPGPEPSRSPSPTDEEDPYGGLHPVTPKTPRSVKPLNINKGKGKARGLSIPAPSAPVSPFSSAHPSPSSRRDMGANEHEDAKSAKSIKGKSMEKEGEGDHSRRGSAISLSPTRSWTSGTSISTEDAPIAKVDKNERSAVTPQLPVLALSSAGLGGWSVGGHGDAKEDEDDGEERIKSPSPPA